MWLAMQLAGAFDHFGVLRRELRENQRALEIHFNELDELRKEGFDMKLLWRRGDSLKTAQARLAALTPGPKRRARNARHSPSSPD